MPSDRSKWNYAEKSCEICDRNFKPDHNQRKYCYDCSTGQIAGRKAYYYIFKAYGMTPTTFNALLDEQDQRCGICSKRFNDQCKINVDHDHISLKVRGLLCTRCNGLLGALEDEEFCANARSYLKYPPIDQLK
jgi:hypothetical protein